MFARKFRRKLAGLVLGDQIGLYIPKDQKERFQNGFYEQFDDKTLAMMSRFWFYAIGRTVDDLAQERNVPITVYSTSKAATALAMAAAAANADSYVIDQDLYDRGESRGKWRIEVTRLPDDHVFGEPRVEKEYDGDKLTRLTIAYSFETQHERS